VVVDAHWHVCPERLLDAISERHPSAEVAALRKNSYLFDGERRLRYMDLKFVTHHLGGMVPLCASRTDGQGHQTALAELGMAA
jgi:hypothetical protein